MGAADSLSDNPIIRVSRVDERRARQAREAADVTAQVAVEVETAAEDNAAPAVPEPATAGQVRHESAAERLERLGSRVEADAHKKPGKLETSESIGIWWMPNFLTVLRLIMVPVVLAAVMLNYWWLALIVFCVAAVTDFFDGYYARKHNVVSNFGKIADPIADKALTLGVFLVFSILGLLYWWFTIVLVLREVSVTLLRMVLLRRGVVVPASKGGKLKTVLQMLLIILILLSGVIPVPASATTAFSTLIVIVLVLAFAVTIVSGIQYFIDAFVSAGVPRGNGVPDSEDEEVSDSDDEQQ